jgi:signal transduction histidine kinase/ligand-binding sensor domain-containing protein
MIRTFSDSFLCKVPLLGIAFFSLAAAIVCLDAAALDPHRLLTQYGHTAWRTQDGFVNLPGAITQTTDGYIWIGVSNGILRFDGVRFTPWFPPSGQILPSTGISYLLGSHDGSLWIGTYHGLARLKDGKLFSYAGLSWDSGISSIIEDHAGRIWVTRYQVHDGKGSLCRVEGDELHCYGKNDGNPGRYGLGLAEDSSGDIWFGCQMLCRRTVDSFSISFEHQQTDPAGVGVLNVVAGPSGSLWASLDGAGPGLGVQYYANGKWRSYDVPGFKGDAVRSHTLFIDRDKTLWVGTDSQGLYHIHDGFADHYGVADGLSGNTIEDLFEDSEGNLWVTTDKGLDLFRDITVATFSSSEQLSGAAHTSILALKDGSVWVGSSGALDVIRGGQVAEIKANHGLPGQDVDSMFEDHTGRVWLGVNGRLMIYDNARFVEAKKSDGRPIGQIGGTPAITEDTEGNIWANVVSDHQRRLLRIRNERVQQEIPLGPVANEVGFLAPDRDIGIWVGDRSDKVVRFRGNRKEVVSLANGDKTLITRSIVVAPDNALWVATTKGLYRWKDGHLSLLNSENGLPCSNILSAIVDNSESLWLNAACGILKVSATEFANWVRQPTSKVAFSIFDQFDGAHSSSGALQPIEAKSPDGRLWFVGSQFVQMIDPNRSYFHPSPPPVHVEEIIADQKAFSPQDDIRLAPGPHDIEIRYTALSFALPQRVRFRYMLEGQDKGWQDPGTRREAFYTNIAPGPYRFHVIACNSDGVWNETGAELRFTVAPAYYQTWWFRALFSLAAAAALWILYLVRLKQATAEIQARLGERMDERERIARELHDTLLQSFQGITLHFQRARNLLPDRTAEAIETLDTALDGAEEAIVEGRDAIHDLRSPTISAKTLAEEITALGEELAAKVTNQEEPVQFRTVVEGSAYTLRPTAHIDIFRITREAIRNAFIHSQGRLIETEIAYTESLFRLRIRDDGKGIDPDERVRAERTGHWGLRGMRERAERLGGELEVWSEPGAGTEIELRVPASISYETVPSQDTSWHFWRRKRNP